MLRGVLTLLTRSMREDALLLGPHLIRGGMVFCLIVIGMWSASIQFSTASPGLGLFYGMMLTNLILVSLAGTSYFATPIAEEKEEETLGLLMMAGVSRLGILLGKSTSRLIFTLVMGLIELPFLLLAVTLGGVTRHQIWCGFAMVTGFAVLVSNLGLLCSVVCSTTVSASRWMMGILLIYTFFPWLMLPVWIMSMSGGSPTPTQKMLLDLNNWISETSPWSRIWQICRTGYASHPISSQVISNLIGGGVCFTVAWILFDRFARDLSQAVRPGTRSMFQRIPSKSQRCVGNPFIWKDFMFQSGGFKRMGLNVVLLGLGMLAYTAYSFGTWSSPTSFLDDDFLGPAFGIMIFVSTLHLASMSSRYVSVEYRDHTLPILYLTPNSAPVILYGKLVGTFFGALPTVGLTIALWWGLILDWKIPDGTFMVVGITLLYIGIYLHLVVLLSLFLKWGAVPVAVGVMLAGTFFWTIMHASGGMGDSFLEIVFSELLVVIVVLHGAVAARISNVVQK